jgi:hypothetical protein
MKACEIGTSWSQRQLGQKKAWDGWSEGYTGGLEQALFLKRFYDRFFR